VAAGGTLRFTTCSGTAAVTAAAAVAVVLGTTVDDEATVVTGFAAKTYTDTKIVTKKTPSKKKRN